MVSQEVQIGDLVGIYLPRSVDAFVALLGILKAGATYVMLDPQQPLERLYQMCDRGAFRLLLSSRTQLASASAVFDTRTLCLDDLTTQRLLDAASNRNPDIALADDTPAFAYFTSGSTGPVSYTHLTLPTIYSV